MGMSYRQYLAGARIYGCSACKTHLATIHSMLSRVSPGCFSWLDVIAGDLHIPQRSQAFNGQHGRAYLFEGV